MGFFTSALDKLVPDTRGEVMAFAGCILYCGSVGVWDVLQLIGTEEGNKRLGEIWRWLRGIIKAGRVSRSDTGRRSCNNSGMKWVVKGVRRDDGRDASITVDADAQSTAEGIAQLSGILVETCDPEPLVVRAQPVMPPPMIVVPMHRPTSRPWQSLTLFGSVALAVCVALVALSGALTVADPGHAAGAALFMVIGMLGVMLSLILLFIALLAWVFRS